MTAFDEYRRALKDLDDPEPFLLERSCLPGPRGNIELAHAMADVGTREQFDRFLSFTPDRAPVGSREEFLAFCAAIGFGRLAAEGNRKVLMTLRTLAADPRWRVREGWRWACSGDEAQPYEETPDKRGVDWVASWSSKLGHGS